MSGAFTFDAADQWAAVESLKTVVPEDIRVPLYERVTPDGVCYGANKRLPSGLPAEVIVHHPGNNKKRGRHQPPRSLVRVNYQGKWWFGWLYI